MEKEIEMECEEFYLFNHIYDYLEDEYRELCDNSPMMFCSESEL